MRRASILLLSSLAAAAAAAATAVLVNCASPSNLEGGLSEDDITGVNNTLGLGLAYDSKTNNVKATLKQPLGAGEKLFIRVRRGVITHESQQNLNCGELSEAPPITYGRAAVNGKIAYEGPSVSKELIDLLSIYNDERWYGGKATPEMKAEIAKGPDSIVEACVMRDGKVRAKLLTNLAYAWDRGEELNSLTVKTNSVHALAGDAGANGEPLANGQPIPEGAAYNMIDYANLCVQELGEIPFFKKISDGKYETFDCRDFEGSGGAIEGAEGVVVPLTVNDQPQEKCSEGRESRQTYDCVDKCDRAMWLTASSRMGLGEEASCQPGVTVATVKNAEGSHWVLLCRKVDNSNGQSMMKTKTFNDIAMIGTNPRTGKTCFFQNKEDVGNDGARVTHPADVAKSSAIWPSTPSSYCTGSCHGADPFVHSPWIDQAKRADGHPIVPKMGEDRDFPISNLELPYKVVNGPAQGFKIPKQLVSEDAAPCTTCHRIAGDALAEFGEFATGTGDAYYSKITDPYKAFEKSHWMPLRLDGLTAENFDGSKWGVAVKHIRKCMDQPNSQGCDFAAVPTE